jgi:hypothetical protein
MQAIEFAAKISMQGGIALPANLKALYGRDARMILLVDDGVAPAQSAQSNRGERQAKLQQAMADVAQAGTFAQIQMLAPGSTRCARTAHCPVVRIEPCGWQTVTF